MRRMRQRMQMVFQDPYGSLHPRHTVDTALSEPLKIHKMDSIGERVRQMLLKVGLNDSFRSPYPPQTPTSPLRGSRIRAPASAAPSPGPP
eukprot:gene33084-37385_t